MEKQNTESAKSLMQRISIYIKNIADIHIDTNEETTINSISKDIEFRGSNVWILFFAVIVASVGLNMNSTAVIIGAMLISPLMGPINGVGLAIGINDNELLRNSLRNLLTMVVISLLASTTYFSVSPISDAQSELLARTNPTIFDVLIAFFGGMAGIIAASRKESKITIISGVAIATALMPPLCTAGYGLASGQFSYFFGAFYLFFINSFFIALATFIMVRYLKFSVKQFVDPARRRIVKRTITIFSIIVITPSIYIAWNMVNETRFNSQAIKYVQEIQKLDLFREVEIIQSNRNYSRNDKQIAMSLIGKELTEEQIDYLRTRLIDFDLADVKLIVKQTGGNFDINANGGIITNIFDKQELALHKKDSIINELKDKLTDGKIKKIDEIQIAKEIKTQYPTIKRFSYSNTVFTNTKFLTQDTLPTFFVEWDGEGKDEVESISNWIKVRLNLKDVKIIEIK